MDLVPTSPRTQLEESTAVDFHGIVGRSAPMKALFRLIEKAAPFPA